MSEKECNKMKFIKMISDHKIILNKSQLPEVKIKKSVALKELKRKYDDAFGPINETQLMKKINNMKTDVKSKSDINKTGNKKIILKSWEQEFLEILRTNDNPTFTKISGGISAGFSNDDEIHVNAEENNSSQHISVPETASVPCNKNPLPPKIKLPETEETRSLSTSQLQRLVLLEQLSLIRMQMEQTRQQNSINNNETTSTESVLKFYEY